MPRNSVPPRAPSSPADAPVNADAALFRSTQRLPRIASRRSPGSALADTRPTVLITDARVSAQADPAPRSVLIMLAVAALGFVAALAGSTPEGRATLSAWGGAPSPLATTASVAAAPASSTRTPTHAASASPAIPTDVHRPLPPVTEAPAAPVTVTVVVTPPAPTITRTITVTVPVAPARTAPSPDAPAVPNAVHQGAPLGARTPQPTQLPRP